MDLRVRRQLSYEFSYERMLDVKSDTAVYLLYGYARVVSLLEKATESLGRRELQKLMTGANLDFEDCAPVEWNLALHLLRFHEVCEQAALGLDVHHVSSYVFELANLLHQFYNECPVLRAPSRNVRDRRIFLCELSRAMMHRCLGLLGIRTVNRL